MKFNTKTNLLALIAIILIGIVLRYTGQIFVPLIISIMLAYLFQPVINLISGRHKIPRLISICLVLLTFLSVSFLSGLLVFSSIRTLIGNLSSYQEQINFIIDQIITRFNLPPNIVAQLFEGNTLRTILISISGDFLDFLRGLLLVFFFLLFLLLEIPSFPKKISKIFERRIRISAPNRETQSFSVKRITIILARTSKNISKYLGIKTIISVSTGLIVFGLFASFGVDFPIIWGVLAFLFNFIPIIGSIAISFLASILVLIQFYPQWNIILLIAGCITVVQIIIGNFVEPRILGGSLSINAVTIILGLLFWGWLWGIAGAFLSMPILAAIKITCENIEPLKPIAIIMEKTEYKKKRNSHT